MEVKRTIQKSNDKHDPWDISVLEVFQNKANYIGTGYNQPHKGMHTTNRVYSLIHSLSWG